MAALLRRPMIISTHAPLAGRDVLTSRNRHCQSHFNPRAPCGARLKPVMRTAGVTYFNPRAPCGARHIDNGLGCTFDDFNPRAPCGARPQPYLTHSRKNSPFQPTRPLRGATLSVSKFATLKRISTHAPLAGRDHNIAETPTLSKNFNPRAPCGARLLIRNTGLARHAFQPTRPLRGATVVRVVPRISFEISTHAPLAGRDRYPAPRSLHRSKHFNPRAPCGARPGAMWRR